MSGIFVNIGSLSRYGGRFSSLSRKLTSGVAPAGTEISQALSFFALRVPSGTTYSDPLIKVKRTADGVEQTFSASAAVDSNGDKWLDTAAVLAFVGASTGEVTGWYDQRTGLIATQTVSANTPKIVINGVLQTVNGRPAIRHTGGFEYWNYSGFPTSGRAIFIATVQGVATGGTVGLLGSSLDSTYLPIGASGSPTNTNAFRVFGTNDPAGLETYVNGSTVPVAHNRSAQFFALSPNASPIPTVVWRVGAVPMSANAVNRIGAAVNGFQWVGYFCELAAYPSTFTPASVLAVERNMGGVRGVSI